MRTTPNAPVRRGGDGCARFRHLVAALSLCVAFVPAAEAGAVEYPASSSGSASASSEISRTLRAAVAADREVATFYRSRDYRPLWLIGGMVRPEAEHVVTLLRNAAADGLDPDRYNPDALSEAIVAAQDGDPVALARAEFMLSDALAAYASDLRRTSSVNMLYVDRDLAPQALSPAEALDAVASASSVGRGIESVTRMNPLYTRLRDAFATFDGPTAQAQLVRANLERARALPAEMGRRYVLVDAASAQLWMVEDGEIVGNMRVVVGRPGEQTPMMAGYIRHLTLNPYWNVPPDLVPRLIAPNVVRRGVSYLDQQGYEVLSDWSADAEPVDPSTIDWQAVADGNLELRVRQRPGPANSMGRVKFMFPNERGVYLHDTPNRELFRNADRRNSAGCVRVEDADRLASWLFGSRPRPNSDAPEQNVDLPERVPVYITYLTARPENGSITFQDDIYGRDRQLLASVGGSTSASRR